MFQWKMHSRQQSRLILVFAASNATHGSLCGYSTTASRICVIQSAHDVEARHSSSRPKAKSKALLFAKDNVTWPRLRHAPSVSGRMSRSLLLFAQNRIRSHGNPGQTKKPLRVVTRPTVQRQAPSGMFQPHQGPIIMTHSDHSGQHYEGEQGAITWDELVYEMTRGEVTSETRVEKLLEKLVATISDLTT